MFNNAGNLLDDIFMNQYDQQSNGGFSMGAINHQSLYNQYAAQANIGNAAQGLFNQPKPVSWVINGRSMTIDAFATELFGDTPEKTMFLLKYGENKNG
jgi:hypothetical protein